MPSKSSKWELSVVHYIAKFTISRFECMYFQIVSMKLHFTDKQVCIKSNRSVVLMKYKQVQRLTYYKIHKFFNYLGRHNSKSLGHIGMIFKYKKKYSYSRCCSVCKMHFFAFARHSKSHSLQFHSTHILQESWCSINLLFSYYVCAYQEERMMIYLQPYKYF